MMLTTSGKMVLVFMTTKGGRAIDRKKEGSVGNSIDKPKGSKDNLKDIKIWATSVMPSNLPITHKYGILEENRIG